VERVAKVEVIEGRGEKNGEEAVIKTADSGML
jgi:DNA-nicking Smr family endonuclease